MVIEQLLKQIDKLYLIEHRYQLRSNRGLFPFLFRYRARLVDQTKVMLKEQQLKQIDR